MSSLESRVPPPAVVLVMAVLMWLISRAAPLLHFDVPAHKWLAAVLVSVGFVTGMSGVMTFPERQNNRRSDEASRFVDGHVGGLRAFSQSDVLGRSHHVAGLGSLLVERASLLASSRVRPVYQPLPNRT